MTPTVILGFRVWRKSDPSPKSIYDFEPHLTSLRPPHFPTTVKLPASLSNLPGLTITPEFRAKRAHSTRHLEGLNIRWLRVCFARSLRLEHRKAWCVFITCLNAEAGNNNSAIEFMVSQYLQMCFCRLVKVLFWWY